MLSLRHGLNWCLNFYPQQPKQPSAVLTRFVRPVNLKFVLNIFLATWLMWRAKFR